MSRDLETIDASASSFEAAKKMRDRKISSLLVVNKKDRDGKPLGIVTERDLVCRICAQGSNGKDVYVKDIMSSPIATIDPQTTVEGAADIMLSNKVRHLLVLDTDAKMTPVGIVAPTDLNKYLQANIDMDEVQARILKALQSSEEIGWA